VLGCQGRCDRATLRKIIDGLRAENTWLRARPWASVEPLP
jgi:hypothetical protein